MNYLLKYKLLKIGPDTEKILVILDVYSEHPKNIICTLGKSNIIYKEIRPS